MSKIIFIDERVDHIDFFTIRYIFSSVEITSSNISKIKTIGKKYYEKVTNKQLKLHSNNLSTESIKEYISDVMHLGFMIKIYIYYYNSNPKQELQFKRESLIKTVHDLIEIQSDEDTQIFIEHTDDYRKIIKAHSLEKDPLLSLLPDIICSIVARYYSIGRGLNKNDYSEMMDTIKSRIDLVTVKRRGTTTRLKRGNII